MGSERRFGSQRGQAMLETILIISLLSIIVGMALRELGTGFGERQKNLEFYYSMPFP